MLNVVNKQLIENYLLLVWRYCWRAAVLSQQILILHRVHQEALQSLIIKKLTLIQQICHHKRLVA